MTKEDINMSGRIRTGYRLLIVVLSLLVPASVFAEQSSMREYPYIYKSARAMGMGGAYTAVGGRVDSLFYNPAGLINIPQDKGWEVNLINLSAELGKNVQDVYKDAKDAADVGDLNGDGKTDDDRLRAMVDVLNKYRGSNLHGLIADFSSIGKSWDSWAFGVGGIGSAKLDTMIHQGFGEQGFAEMNANLTTGGLGGVSIGVADNVFVGLAVKSLHRDSLTHNFSAQDNLGDTSNLQDEYVKSGDAVGADLGVIWKFGPNSDLNPTFGASIMNVGDLKFGDAGKIPQSVNLGIAINPEITWSRRLTVAADYIDLLDNYKQDKDIAKRMRMGAELQLFDIWPVELALRAGVYNNAPTAGFDLRLLILSVTYAMYTEELGAYAGQDKDKRQLITLNLGW